MLKRMFALSNQGSRDLNKGIAATTLSNLCLIAPVSLLVKVCIFPAAKHSALRLPAPF